MNNKGLRLTAPSTSGQTGRFALLLLAATMLSGCLKTIQVEPDVMIVEGPPAGTVQMRVPYHVASMAPPGGFLAGGAYSSRFWFNPFSPNPWGLSPYAGAFTSMYYPWYGWSPMGWRRTDPVLACMHGGRGPGVCRPGWLVPSNHGPALVDDEYVPRQRSPEVPYRPTYGGLPVAANIATGTGTGNPWRIYQERRAELDRWYERRYTGTVSNVDVVAAARAARGEMRGFSPDRYSYQRITGHPPDVARSVRSAGAKVGQSRTQPAPRIVRPDVARTPRSSFPAVRHSGARSTPSRPSAPASSSRPGSSAAGSNYQVISER